VHAGEHLEQIVQVAPGDEQQLAPAPAQALQRLLAALDDAPVVGQRLVVVGGKRGESHGPQGKAAGDSPRLPPTTTRRWPTTGASRHSRWQARRIAWPSG